MSLKNEINEEIRQAFDTDLADAVTDFTLVRESVTDDDWADNTQSVTQTMSGRGIFMGFGSREIDGETIRRDDVKLIVLQSETPSIKLNDKIDGMDVVHIAKDPADTVWTVQLRRV